MTLESDELLDLARLYTAAWCSQDPRAWPSITHPMVRSPSMTAPPQWGEPLSRRQLFIPKPWINCRAGIKIRGDAALLRQSAKVLIDVGRSHAADSL